MLVFGDRIFKWLDLHRQANDMVFPVVSEDGVEFPDDIHEDFLNAMGRQWDPIKKAFNTMSFKDHQTGKGCMQSSAVLAGASAGGMGSKHMKP